MLTPPPVLSVRQRGLGLIVVFLLVVLAVLGYLVTGFNTTSDRASRIATTGSDLQIARDAVLAFNFAKGADARDPDKMSLGRLPLPDMGRRGVTDPNMANDHEGASAGVGLVGNAAATVLLGRFPWKTVGTAPLRDESGECLWYGVSAAWKNTNNQPSANPLRYLPPAYNWDTLGDFDLVDERLQPVYANPHRNRAVAVFFAAGPPLPGQNRTSATAAAQAAAGEYVGRCSGNYDARNYLDPPDLTAATGNRFNAFSTQVASTHVDYSSDPAGRNGMSANPPAGPKNVLAQPVGTQASGALVAITNDRAVAITNDEIFEQLLKQTHPLGVTAKINEMLTQTKACLEASNPSAELPSTGLAVLGQKKVGRLDASITCPTAPELERWRDNLWYAMIPKANGPTKLNATCDGVLVFSGTRAAAQRRSDAGEKANLANYLEATATLFNNAATLAAPGPATFGLAGNPPTTDIVTCLTHPAPTSYAVNVGNLTDRLAVNLSGQTLLQRNTVAQTITLGNPAAASGSFGSASAVACTWFNNPQLFGNGLRAYFSFQFKYYNSASTTPVGPGFTFALADAAANAANVCGGSVPNGSTNRGQLLGYAGVMEDAAGNVVSTIAPPKMAIEFDTAQNADRNDTTGSHVAVVYWGIRDADGDNDLDDDNDGYVDQENADDDNRHAVPPSPQSDTQRDPINDSAYGYSCFRDPINPTPPGTCPHNDLAVVDRTYHVRVDIERTYDASFLEPTNPAITLGRATYWVRVWVRQDKLANMDNLNSDFKTFVGSPSPDLENRDQNGDSIKDPMYIYNVVPGVEAFRLLRFGFTVAQPTRQEEVVISNLQATPRP